MTILWSWYIIVFDFCWTNAFKVRLSDILVNVENVNVLPTVRRPVQTMSTKGLCTWVYPMQRTNERWSLGCTYKRWILLYHLWNRHEELILTANVSCHCSGAQQKSASERFCLTAAVRKGARENQSSFSEYRHRDKLVPPSSIPIAELSVWKSSLWSAIHSLCELLPEPFNNMANSVETVQPIFFPIPNYFNLIVISLVVGICHFTEAQPSGGQTFATFYGAANGDGSDGKFPSKSEGAFFWVRICSIEKSESMKVVLYWGTPSDHSIRHRFDLSFVDANTTHGGTTEAYVSDRKPLGMIVSSGAVSSMKWFPNWVNSHFDRWCLWFWAFAFHTIRSLNCSWEPTNI